MLTTEVYFTMRDDQCVDAVSFCDVIGTTSNTLRFDIFYNGPEDASVILSHVCAFLRRCEKSAKAHKHCQVAFQFAEWMHPEQVAKALSPVFGIRHKEAASSLVIVQTKEKLAHET